MLETQLRGRDARACAADGDGPWRGGNGGAGGAGSRRWKRRHQEVAGDGVDDGICGENGGVTVGRMFQRGKEERDEVGEMQKVTRSTLGWSERPGKARSGRGLRRSAVAVAGGRRSRRRYEAPGLDSFRQVEEESEADVLVGLDGRGGGQNVGTPAVLWRRRRFAWVQ